MQFSPILLLHICAGTLGVLSGGVAVLFRKGSRPHGAAGNVFVISMLGLASSGAYMAFVKSQPGNFLGGALTFYLVATAWITARRSEGKPAIFDWGALLAALAVGAVAVTFGFEAAASPTGRKYGDPAGQFFFLGLVALLAATGDFRIIVRRGISGGQRIARHLWRMCFAWFVAAASVFLARQHLFPALLQRTGMLLLLSFLPLILMIFWLFRVLYTKKGRAALPGQALPGLKSDDRVVYPSFEPSASVGPSRPVGGYAAISGNQRDSVTR